MATGRLGKAQVEAFAELLRETGAKGLARVVLIHHPPLAGVTPPLRGLSDAPAFERVVRNLGAEAILHGHIHRQAVRSLRSRSARTIDGSVPVLSAPSAAAAASHPRYRAAYHLVRLAREGERWRVSARARGLGPESTDAAPLMATGRLGKPQVEAFAELLRETGAKGLAQVVLIHHPPLSGVTPPLRGLSDAPAFERVVRNLGAEAILHGHIHRQAVRSLRSRSARTIDGSVPVLSAPSAAAAASHPRYRAAYHLVRLAREGERWRVSARSRGLGPESQTIGEREALGV